jgi:hypothetical protein
VTALLELRAHGGEVVDLSVEDDGGVRRRHRLVPAGHVDDRQAPEAQAHRAVDEDPFIVGPAVHQRVRHRAHPGLVGRLLRAHESNDAAHDASRALSPPTVSSSRPSR